MEEIHTPSPWIVECAEFANRTLMTPVAAYQPPATFENNTPKEEILQNHIERKTEAQQIKTTLYNLSNRDRILLGIANLPRKTKPSLGGAYQQILTEHDSYLPQKRKAPEPYRPTKPK